LEAEFFALHCGINQATCSHEISKIIIITDSIHAAKKIFDPLAHALQKQALTLGDLRKFFNCCPENIIEFWECPSKSNWHLHKAVDTDTWNFSKKVESNDIINK